MNESLARVMICEDERLFAKDLASRLRQIGYEVCGIASNDAEAFEIASRAHPELALMDIRLEGSMTGTEVAKILSSDFDIPFIYLSAYNDPSTMEKVRETEPLGFLSKPIDDQSLQSVIEFGLRSIRKQRNLQQRLRLALSPESVEEEQPSPSRGLVSPEKILRRLSVFSPTLIKTSREIAPRIERCQKELRWLSECFSLRNFERRHVKKVMEEIEKIREFLRRIRVAAGVSGRTLRSVRMSQLLEDTLQGFNFFSESGRCTVHFVPEHDISVFADVQMVQEALQELLRNACELSLPDASVEISLKREQRNSSEKKSSQPSEEDEWFAVVSIRNHGAKLTEEESLRVFEPFYSKTPRSFGLGLSVAFGVAYMHGGWIEMEPIPENGMEVRMLLPL